MGKVCESDSSLSPRLFCELNGDDDASQSLVIFTRLKNLSCSRKCNHNIVDPQVENFWPF